MSTLDTCTQKRFVKCSTSAHPSKFRYKMKACTNTRVCKKMYNKKLRGNTFELKWIRNHDNRHFIPVLKMYKMLTRWQKSILFVNTTKKRRKVYLIIWYNFYILWQSLLVILVCGSGSGKAHPGPHPLISNSGHASGKRLPHNQQA